MTPQRSSAVVLWNAEGIITRVEANAAQILGATPGVLEGRALVEVLGISATQRAELEATPPEGVLCLRGSRTGQPATFRCQVSRTSEGAFVAEVCDLGALLEGAPPLQISRLSSSLSHEIRNPLSSVKMAVQTLARNPGLSPRDQRRLNIANREVRTMERMLALLSEYGREAPAHVESVSLRSLVQEAAALVELELQERQSVLSLDEAEGLPRVKADSARTGTVLAQLLLNVAMGQEPGSPLVATLRPHGEGADLRLEDRAATLLPEDVATLFEPFGSRLARGAGLSLAALRRVMQGQGGSVRAEAAGAGTVFTLTFAPA